ncbi:Outer membrane protein TolC [Dyadobacter sp. CECT 9275]|uniref:Outer membrane protein TolC n=1 Tax=Dyadobacter helix TaxID=2822344 RepID=A0A916JAC4_9BACT|nr:TolC family protein [Dyadobacter sp. CECT 9275]CAG4995269.1 Outer membrane protein TolC [Dyadobacter sp. CECT 9275]
MNDQSKPERTLRLALSIAFVLFYSLTPLLAQNEAGKRSEETLENANLEGIIQYAIKNQPVIQKSLIDERITENQIRSKLADWYPQINFNYNLQHNFIVQTSIIAGNPVKLGVRNVSAAQFTLSQQIFNRDVLLANRTRADVQLQASQNTGFNKIDIAVNVSKAFYDVLATSQQIRVATEDIVRLERSLKDAGNQYKAGIADKIDYKRATISLNNTRANKKSNEEILKAKLEYLKSLMGYPAEKELRIAYDTLQMEREMMLDTLQSPDFNNRIEFQLLTTQKRLAEANLQYNKWSYLPNVSLNGAYNLNFQNNQFTDLYGRNYPNSFGLITLSLPIFQGGKRKANVNQAQWQLKRTDWDILGLKMNISSEYATALANYKGNLTNLLAQKENVDLAREVYDVIQLQYRSGIKTYLEVVTSETDLRLARINYYNALYDVLASKIDVQKALGQLNY